MTVVSGTARVLVRVSTTLLPSGQTRERYRREHDGELHALAADQQIRYAMGALTTAWALRQAVVQERDMTVSPTKPRKPVLCSTSTTHGSPSVRPAGSGIAVAPSAARTTREATSSGMWTVSVLGWLVGDPCPIRPRRRTTGGRKMAA